MKTPLKSMRSPLGTARGLGSAKHGTGHWLAQRVTAVILIPALAYLLLGFMCHVVKGDYATTYAWLQQPFTGAFLFLFMIAGFYHAVLGMQVVIEDYVHNEMTKILSIITVKLVAGFFFILGAVALLRIQLMDVPPHV